MPATQSKLASTLLSSQIETAPISSAELDINCGKNGTPTATNGNTSVIFPSGMSKVPAYGGAILELDLGSRKINFSDTSSTKFLTDFKSSLSESITDADVTAISSALFAGNRIEFEKILNKFYHDFALNKKINSDITEVPKLYLCSTTLTTDAISNLKESDSNDLIRVCEFKFLPIEIFSSIEKKFESISQNIYGYSGKNLKEIVSPITSSGGSLSSDDAVNIFLDLVPFFIIEEDDIAINRQRSKLLKGGFFTFVGSKIFIKFPDISGRNAVGLSSDSIQDAYNICLQCVFPTPENSSDEKTTSSTSSGSVTNFILDILYPPSGNIADYDDEFNLKDVTSSNFDVIFEYSGELPKKAYLSLVNDKYTSSSWKNSAKKYNLSANGSSSGIEASPFPNPWISTLGQNKIPKTTSGIGASYVGSGNYKNLALTIDEGGDSGAGTLFYNSIVADIKILLTKMYGSEKSSLVLDSLKLSGFYDFNELGIPILSPEKIDQNLGMNNLSIFGSLSRHDVALANYIIAGQDKPKISKKNDKIILDKKAIINNSKISLNYRPRVHKTASTYVPSKLFWVEGNVSESGDGIATASFDRVAIINSLFAGEEKAIPDQYGITFALYCGDSEDCQISKIDDAYVNIVSSSASLDLVSPDGTKEKGLKITSGEATTLTIGGSGLLGVVKAIIGGLEVSFKPKNDEEGEVELPDGNLIPTGTSEIKLVSSSGEETEPLNVYIASPAEAFIDLPSLFSGKQKINISPEKTNLLITNTDQIIIDYDNPTSEIIIKSKKSIFKEKNTIYAYLGLLESDKAIAESISISEYIKGPLKSQKGDNSSIIVLSDINWTLSNSFGSSFYRMSRKKARLSFPGPEYQSKPLQNLLGVKNAFIVVSTKSPSEITELISFDSIINDIDFVSLGKETTIDDQKVQILPFVSPPVIVGTSALIVNQSNKEVTRPRSYLKTDDNIYKVLDGGVGPERGSSFGPLSATEKISKLVVVCKYKVLNSNFKAKHISLLVGGEEVDKSYYVERAKLVPGSFDTIYFEISNYEIYDDKELALEVKIKDKTFKVNTSSANKYYDLSSQDVDLSKISISETRISTKEDFVHTYIPWEYNVLYSRSEDVFLSGSDQFLSGLFAETYKRNDKILFEDKENPTTSFPNISIQSDCDLILKDGSGENTLSLLSNSPKTDVSILPVASLSIPAGSTIINYSEHKPSSKYKIYNRIKIFNTPKIPVAAMEILAVNKQYVTGGDELKITIKNRKKFLKIFIGGKRAKIIGDDTKTITAKVPKSVDKLLLTTNCIELKVAGGNQQKIKAELQLGVDVVAELDAITAKVSGLIQDTVGDITAFIEDVIPVKYFQFLKTFPNIIGNFIKSICDISFHLTAELSLKLESFQILLIPIQVIFCIIDVICSLFNPFELPLAIIRLFECLYDLILLLPQISIPVMFLQLMLHLEGLLECLIEKILNTIIIITLVIDVIAEIFSKDGFDWKQLLLLEEVLLKHVLILELDLNVLNPIISIIAVFLQLLSLSFRFPCQISPTSGDDCGITGGMLHGFILGGITTDDEATGGKKLKTEYLLPVAQPITTDDLDPSDPNGSTITDPAINETVTTKTSSTTFYDGVSIDPDYLRIDSGSSPGNVTYAISYTKSKKTAFSLPQKTTFQFNERGKSFFPNIFPKFFDPSQALDSPPILLKKSGDGNSLQISSYGSTPDALSSSSKTNMISLLDGEEFFNFNYDNKTASVKNFTTQIEVDGSSVTRTFASIPKLVILDQNYNCYSIDEDGIIFNDEGKIEKIRATVLNQASAPEFGTNAEEQEIDPDTTNETDDDVYTMKVLTFPQLYFVDVRAAESSIQSACETSSINMIPFDQEDVTPQVEKVRDCLDLFTSEIKDKTTGIKRSLEAGEVPTTITSDFIQNLYNQLKACLNEAIDGSCQSVVNTLNTSFRLTNDIEIKDPTLSLSLPDGAADSFSGSGPALTGAREFAAGVGDEATVFVGEMAEVLIIPRDSYDNTILKDLSSKISLDIISDTTGDATIITVTNEDGEINQVSFNEDYSYYGNITSTIPGIVKIKARICTKTVQAITYSDLVNNTEEESGIDCIPDSTTTTEVVAGTPFGGLSRIDRVLTINFVAKESTTVYAGISSDGSIITNPQEFGTSLEN